MGGVRERSTDLSPKQFDFVTNINYRGVWLSSRAELAQMLKQEPLPTHDGRAGNKGSIVNIASQLGIVSTFNAREYHSLHKEKWTRVLKLVAAYCAAKAAVISMTKSDAIDVRAHRLFESFG